MSIKLIYLRLACFHHLIHSNLRCGYIQGELHLLQLWRLLNYLRVT